MRPRLLPVCSRRPSYNGTSLLSWQPCHSSPRGVKHMGWVNCLGVHPDPGQEVVLEPCFRHLPSARGGRAFQGEGVSPPPLGLCPRVLLLRVTEGMEGWRRRGLAQSLGHNRFAGTAGQASQWVNRFAQVLLCLLLTAGHRSSPSGWWRESGKKEEEIIGQGPRQELNTPGTVIRWGLAQGHWVLPQVIKGWLSRLWAGFPGGC